MIVITGGAGFIGSNLVAGLEAAGHQDLVVADWLGTGEKWRNLSARPLADIVKPENLLDWLDGRAGAIRAVFHMGANSATTETDGDRILDENVRPTLALWDWCTQHRVPFIYASSAATYGDGGGGFDDDPDPAALSRLKPLNLYGWSKHVADRRMLALAARGAHPPQWAGLKFFNVYGPNEYHKGDMRSVVHKLFPEVAAGRPARLFRSHRNDYPDGGQMRDFVHVEDCVQVMLWLLNTPAVSGLFNVGSGRARSWIDLASAVFRALDREPDIAFIDMPEHLRGRYQYFTQAPVARLRAAGYDRPFTSLEDGIGDYVRGYLATDNPYR